MESNFFGIRLKQARKMAGFSMQQLADELDNIISKQSLSKYESGKMMPSSSVLVSICSILDVRPDFFFVKDAPTLGEISFRKKASTTQRAIDSITERTRNYVERYLEAEELLGETQEFVNPLSDLLITCDEDAENAANALRKAWNLGLMPVSRVIETLEGHGVKVLLLDEDDAIDGLSVFAENSVPIVVVNKRGKPIERLRFTVIHELAHILLNLDAAILKVKKRIEEICHYFSSCFLVPKESLLNELGGKARSYIRIEELKKVKASYGISIRALIHRLKKIGIITDTYYRRWMIFLSKTYGGKEEPGNFIGEEIPKRLEQLVNRGIAEELISMSKGAYLLNVDAHYFQR